MKVKVKIDPLEFIPAYFPREFSIYVEDNAKREEVLERVKKELIARGLKNVTVKVQDENGRLIATMGVFDI